MARPGSSVWRRRLLVLGLVVLLVVVALLLLHLALMGSAHYDGVGCATCTTVLLAAAVLVMGPLSWGTGSLGPGGIQSRLLPFQPLAAIATGRHPPPRGVVLRL